MTSHAKRYRFNQISPASNAMLHVFFILLAVACIIPVILVLAVSLSDGDALARDGYRFIPVKWSLVAYRSLLTDSATVLRGYGVSIMITVFGTIAGVALMGLYAYPLSRRDYPYRTSFTFYLFFTMLFNGGLVSKYIVYTQVLGFRDSYLALIVPLLIVPFNVIIMRTFFQTTIHPALIESAKIDGAGELRIFFRIVFPLSLPVMATMALFSTINYWNDWFNAMLFINTESKYPLQFLMIRVLNNIQYLKDSVLAASQDLTLLADLPDEALQMAMAIVGMGPLLIAYPFFQKYFVKGLTVGAVKG